ncbi:MAG: alpha/beta fold hydrolase, partial [Mycobacteriales bacterium]
MTVPEEDLPDATSVLLPGPWMHRDLSANGVRLHAAECGDGPLVLLLHGFLEFWWTWRAQLPALAAAGFRAVAVDLRGYGASDKPPRGYDLPTLSADMAALIRALGERDAVVVGHDWGALGAWTMAALHPRSVRRLVILSMAHPRRLRAGMADARQRHASRYALRFQLPRLPERRLTRADDDPVAELMRRWAGAEWIRTADFAEAVERYRRAARIPQAAYG